MTKTPRSHQIEAKLQARHLRSTTQLSTVERVKARISYQIHIVQLLATVLTRMALLLCRLVIEVWWLWKWSRWKLCIPLRYKEQVEFLASIQTTKNYISRRTPKISPKQIQTSLSSQANQICRLEIQVYSLYPKVPMDLDSLPIRSQSAIQPRLAGPDLSKFHGQWQKAKRLTHLTLHAADDLSDPMQSPQETSQET